MSSDAATISQRTTCPTSISLEAPLLDAARLKARKNRQSFSSYVATLLERDLAAEAEKQEVGS